MTWEIAFTIVGLVWAAAWFAATSSDRSSQDQKMILELMTRVRALEVESGWIGSIVRDKLCGKRE